MSSVPVHKNNFTRLLSQLIGSLNRQEKMSAAALCAAMGVGAILETIGIAMIMPFIQLINHREYIQTQPRIAKLYELMGSPSELNFIIIMGFALLAMYVLKNLYFVFLYTFQGRFFESKKINLTRDLLSAYMGNPYLFHLQRNTAELIRNISVVTKFIDTVWVPVMLLIVEFFVVTVILAFLFAIQPMATLMAIVAIGLSTAIFYKAVRSKVSIWTRELFSHTHFMIKWLNQSLSGIKEIKVLGKEKFFLNSYMHHYESAAKLNRNTTVLNQMPRLFIETITVAGVVAFVTTILLTKGFAYDLTTMLALFAVAAFRLMPSMNRIVLASITLREGTTLSDLMADCIAELAEQRSATTSAKALAKRSAPAVVFQKTIELRNLSFKYPSAKDASINAVNLTIERGQSVAFVGHSGAGKTTVVNLILGLLNPNSGELLIDGFDISKNIEGWQRKIGYIPQNIFLSDDSILKNVAFGLEDKDISEERVRNVLQIAQLDEFVDTLPDGIHTITGERGARLSAGQQQRIGIARALYHNPEVLVLDEATSALDNETERALSRAIERLSGEKTLIIIAHRLPTVARCDRLFFMRAGKVIDSGTFTELIQKNQDFTRLANG